MQSKTSGQIAEQLACDYLKQQGLKLITRNYHCRRGEIDLIMRDGNTLVFIEVRYRRSQRFGGAIESVTRDKMTKIITTAEHYIQQSAQSFDQYRFDVMAVNSLDKPDLVWLQDAFQPG